MTDMVYWLWLSLALTPGKTTFAKLIEKHNSPRDIYNMDREDYVNLLGSSCADIESLCNKELDNAKEVLAFCTDKKVGILLYSDEEYPNSLREISNPPVLLYYRGTLPDFNTQCFISVVGTRKLTDYGRRNSYSIAFDLARAGAVVVSGMAIGIDGVAMAGALAAGGKTVAVIGSGIDVCYPKVHNRLAREIVKYGCVLTEFPPHTGPWRQNFPIRNRLISGLSSATLVIEGKENSGAILTARHAKRQNRALYALPGNVDNVSSEVSNILIKDGAKLVTSADDIISDFEFVFPGKINPFNLIEKIDMKMQDTLRELEVCCVTPSDDIFNPPRKRSHLKNAPTNGSSSGEASSDGDSDKETNDGNIKKKEEELSGFDKKMLDVYRRIPLNEECTTESLCQDGDTMKDIMRTLMRLEMNRFIKMLPSGKVRRNFT